MKIERPHISFYPAFLKFVEDMKTHGEKLWSPFLPKENESPEKFVARLLQRELEREKGEQDYFVHETIYWAIDNEQMIGRISLRHYLEGNLTKMGGHIGYEVAPSFRNKGFATEMLSQILKTSKAHEIGKLLLTCAPQNIASNKTITKNGGVLTDKVFVEMVNDYRNHYWIHLI
jgi:predicted acetyltransferase